MADQHPPSHPAGAVPEALSSFDPTGAVDAHAPKQWAAGLPAVVNSLRHGVEQMGLPRTARVFGRLNQAQGFDCPSCAWPDPEAGDRHVAEFCESGAKAVAWEATKRRVDREFFARHSIDELDGQSEWWLGQQGRLTEPMHRAPGASHYTPVSWDEANAIMARHLTGLPTPDDAVFYTSGRTSNEAAFLYQLMVRAYGTNNLPDCSNMCHESSGTAMTEQIGIGKGAVTLESLEQAELIVIAGQNPGTNAPRMLTHLERAKENGAVIVAVNPLPEAGLIRFKNPQTPHGLVGPGTALADDYLQVRLGGDHALFRAVGHLLVAAEQAAPGTVVDRDFLDAFTAGYDDYVDAVREIDWAATELATGLKRSEIEALATRFTESKATVVCWAMGLTQHVHAVMTIQEIVNVLLLQGNIGKDGAGPCPIRGHSNVQGDRTMGIWEQMSQKFLDDLGAEFGFTPPTEHGVDATATVKRLRDKSVRVFFGMGGNFAMATPDTPVVHEGLRACNLTVHVSTKLNRSHTVTGTEALILPCLGRTDRDATPRGDQGVTVEDSQGQVHLSRGRLEPPSAQCRSEVAIVAGLAAWIVPGVGAMDWAALSQDNDLIREHISRVVPNFEDYNSRVRVPGGFLLPHKPRDLREFDTPSGKAEFLAGSVPMLEVPEGRLLLQTIRSHDQFNTTIYGHADRYRGISGNRRVVLVNPDDLHRLGFHQGQVVDVVSEFEGTDRRAEGFTLVSYPTAEGCAAAYYPETNVLMSADHVALRSNTPVAKALVIRFEAR
jgi:molybdopterin-dependent oxidoreductase alpha subunit